MERSTADGFLNKTDSNRSDSLFNEESLNRNLECTSSDIQNMEANVGSEGTSNASILVDHESVGSTNDADNSPEKHSALIERFQTDWTFRNYVKDYCNNIYKNDQKIANQRRLKQKFYRNKFKCTDFDPSNKSSMALKDLLYYNHPNEPSFEVPKPTIIRGIDAKKERNERLKSDETTNEYSPDTREEGTILAPQLRLTEDGNIVIDEKSLIIQHEENPVTAGNADLIVESGAQRFDNLTCHSYRRFTFTKRWTTSETAKFYKALSIFGTDFAMVNRLFPSRTRHELKRKFNCEDRFHSSLIDKAIFKSTLSARHTTQPDIACFLPMEDSEELIQKKKGKTEKDDGKTKPKRRRRQHTPSSAFSTPGSDSDDDHGLPVDHKVYRGHSELDRNNLLTSAATNKGYQPGSITQSILTDDIRSIASSSEQEAVLESISRLFADARNSNIDAAPPLVFVSSSTAASSTSGDIGGSTRNQAQKSEIAIHVLTSDTNEDLNAIRLRPQSPSGSCQFSDEQIRQYFEGGSIDDESTGSSRHSSRH